MSNLKHRILYNGYCLKIFRYILEAFMILIGITILALCFTSYYTKFLLTTLCSVGLIVPIPCIILYKNWLQFDIRHHVHLHDKPQKYDYGNGINPYMMIAICMAFIIVGYFITLEFPLIIHRMIEACIILPMSMMIILSHRRVVKAHRAYAQKHQIKH